MSTFSDRALAALAQFTGRLVSFAEEVKSTPPDPPRVPRKTLDELLAIAGRARVAADRVMSAFAHINRQSLDIVDLQLPLQNETGNLASALRDLGDVVERQHFVRERFGDSLVALDESAQLVAAAVFPSAVQGLREVNVKLWDFDKQLWIEYGGIFNRVLARAKLTSEQQLRIQTIANDVKRAFDDVNTLLNDLAESRAADAAGLRKRLEQAPLRLTATLQAADTKLSETSKTFSDFGPVIKASRKVAEEVAKLLRKLTIPVYPTHERLGECRNCIKSDLYEKLSGVQVFALLNILSRMAATKANGRSLMDHRGLRITDVFPDRIYFEANRSLITDLTADRVTFEPAPASLHRFKEGSFKQKSFKKGNLQLSFATSSSDLVNVDADIDLYRSAVPHLFGEVLVNHLTGNTTSQYAVKRILDEQVVAAVGGFQLLVV